MADISLTGAVFIEGPLPRPLKVGATTAVADVVYLDSTDSTAKLATANTAAASQVAGISLNGGAVGNPVNVAGPGSRLTVNAVLTKGVTYYLSATAGKLCPFADLTSGKYISAVAIAESTTILRVLDNACLGVTI